MSRKKVLVMDDEEHVRMLYAEELRLLGFDPVLSDGGDDPLVLIDEHKPDLIILDIRLQNRSGLDVLQIIRCKHGNTPPVIICTAFDSFRLDLKSIAADAYVVKSYDSSELMKKVKELI